MSVYSGGFGGVGNVALLGPAHNTASRVWHQAQQRLKSLLVEQPPNGKGPNGTNPQDRGESITDDLINA